jgi:hypothetical protein
MNTLVRLRAGGLLSVLGIAAVLAGCGSDGSSSGASTSPPNGAGQFFSPGLEAAAAALANRTPGTTGTTDTVAPQKLPTTTLTTPPRAEAQGASGNVSLSWEAPTENTNGTALQNLGGYVIRYGSVSRQYTAEITISNPGLTRYVVESLPAGTYYFSMTATTTSGVQSSPSAEASTTIS